MKLISFVIPSFNTAKYINECIDSILEQNKIESSLFEIIIVDDGSTDNTLALLERYRNNKNIIIIEKENSGISLTRNLGVEKATGEYIFFLDSDDKLSDMALYTISNILNKHKVDILFFSGAVFYDIETQHSFKPIYERAKQTCDTIMNSETFFTKSIRYRSFFVQPCMYVFKRYLFTTNGFIPNILHEDNPFTTDLLLKTTTNVYCINDKIYLRRIRNNSIMTSNLSVKNAHGYLYSVKHIYNEHYILNDYSERNLAIRFFILKLIKCGHTISINIKDSFYEKEFLKCYELLEPTYIERFRFNCNRLYRVMRLIKRRVYLLNSFLFSSTRLSK